jgi:hypothetical protein
MDSIRLNRNNPIISRPDNPIPKASNFRPNCQTLVN